MGALAEQQRYEIEKKRARELMNGMLQMRKEADGLPPPPPPLPPQQQQQQCCGTADGTIRCLSLHGGCLWVDEEEEEGEEGEGNIVTPTRAAKRHRAGTVAIIDTSQGRQGVEVQGNRRKEIEIGVRNIALLLQQMNTRLRLRLGSLRLRLRLRLRGGHS